MNGIKSLLGAAINAIAAVAFMVAHAVDYRVAAIMAAGAIAGGSRAPRGRAGSSPSSCAGAWSPSASTSRPCWRGGGGAPDLRGSTSTIPACPGAGRAAASLGGRGSGRRRRNRHRARRAARLDPPGGAAQARLGVLAPPVPVSPASLQSRSADEAMAPSAVQATEQQSPLVAPAAGTPGSSLSLVVSRSVLASSSRGAGAFALLRGPAGAGGGGKARSISSSAFPSASISPSIGDTSRC